MDHGPKIIAEIADNHGGDMKLAKEFIRILATIGVDYVKFQSWQMERVRDLNAEPMRDWLVNAELTNEQHMELMEECEKQGVKFLTTMFDPHRAEFLASLGLKSIKIGSAECCDKAVLSQAREHFDHVIVSTGMHTYEEVKETADILSGGSFTLMHCVSVYPHTIEQVNLSRMALLRQVSPSVGFSDHSNSLEGAKMAMLLGAEFIERHSAISKYGPGRVNTWDTTPDMWEELVKYRDTIDAAWGDGDIPLNEAQVKARDRFVGRWTGPAHR